MTRERAGRGARSSFRINGHDRDRAVAFEDRVFDLVESFQSLRFAGGGEDVGFVDVASFHVVAQGGAVAKDHQRPAFIGLAHELVHAFRNARGDAVQDTQTEEYLTVGITPTYTINENKIRSDHGINGRTTYVGV